jgi:hypothetical protein
LEDGERRKLMQRNAVRLGFGESRRDATPGPQ